jgi:hypothetical protein
MKLKLIREKRQLRLAGKWEDLSSGDSGEIYFIKQ